jgi:hypothetical protein
MKLALLIALSADKRSGHPLTPEMEPFDQALAKFKVMVEKGVGAAPTVELWSGGRVVKSARFKVVEQSAEAAAAAEAAEAAFAAEAHAAFLAAAAEVAAVAEVAEVAAAEKAGRSKTK